MFDGKNYVAPGPQARQQQTLAVAPVAPLAPKSLLDSHSQLVNLYADQYKQAARSGEIVTSNDQDVSYRLSTAHELAERRKTARMYLCFLAAVNAMATSGVVALAHLADVITGTWHTVAIWLVLFGMVQSVLTWRHLRREQTLSPEGLHLEQIQYDAQVHQTDAQTRRLAIQYAGRAELERVRLQHEEIAAQREANHRLAEEARAKVAQQMQRHTTPQHTLNRLNTYRPEPVQQPEQERRFLIVGCPDDWTDAQALATGTAAQTVPPVEPVTDVVRLRLLDFVTDLYLDRDNTSSYRRMHADGRLRKGIVAPMSKRSGLNQDQRTQMDEILRQIQPPLFRYDDNAKLWYLNLAYYKRVHHAVAAIDATFTPATTWE